MTRWRQWQTIHDRFQVSEPARDEAWRVRRPDRRLDRLRNNLASPFAKKRSLLLGTQGSGKTTELYGLLQAMPGNRVGVYLDVAEHVRNKLGDERVLDRMAAWEVVLLVGLAAWRGAKELGFAEHADGAAILTAAAPLLGASPPAQLDAGKLAGAMVVGVGVATAAAASLPGFAALGLAGGGFEFLKNVAGAMDWKVPLGRGGPAPADADQHARRLLDAVNRVLRSPERTGADWRLVLIIDGLDRVRDKTAIQRLFLESTLLGGLDVFTVATGPVELWRQARLGQLSGWEPTVLPELTVFDPRTPDLPAGQLAFFEELWRRRAGGLDVSITTPGLALLAWASGGRVREFVRLVQNVAIDAFGAQVEEADFELCHALVEHEAQTYASGFHRGYEEVLRQVRDDPEHQLPDVAPRPDGSNLVDELLARYWLLPYRNGQEWFFPHPLLLRRLSHPR